MQDACNYMDIHMLARQSTICAPRNRPKQMLRMPKTTPRRWPNMASFRWASNMGMTIVQVISIIPAMVPARSARARITAALCGCGHVRDRARVQSGRPGKTAFLERTLRELRDRFRVAALVGDLATENDAARLARAGVPVRQITTGTVRHLDAEMVQRAVGGWNLRDLDYLFIENVGNLVCPSSYDLGENARAVLMSVTEGEDKPLKYPTIFNSADVAVIMKLDLAEACEFDALRARANIDAVRPGMRVFEVSARSVGGFAPWLDFVLAARPSRPATQGKVPAS